MTDDERTAIPEAEVTAMLERRADRAGLSDPDRERLVRSIMASVAATPAPVPMRTRFGWRPLAASMAGLALVLAAAGGLIVGMPATLPGSASVEPLATPFELRPTGLRVIGRDELNALIDRHVEGLVIARIDPTPWREDASVALCQPGDRCLSVVATFSRGMPDASIVGTIRAEAALAQAASTGPLGGIAALRLDGSDNVELLGLIDQGSSIVEPLAASVSSLKEAAAKLPMDRTALVVSGWLIGRGPRQVDGHSRLVIDATSQDRSLPDDSIVLADDAHATWTTWVDRDGGEPDNGLFVLRPDRQAPGGWRIVGRLDDDPEPDTGLTIRLGGRTIACGDVPSSDCGMVAAAFARFAAAYEPGIAPSYAIAARTACPANAPAGVRCWQASVGADGVATCTIIGLGGTSTNGYGWTAEPASSRRPAPTGDEVPATCE